MGIPLFGLNHSEREYKHRLDSDINIKWSLYTRYHGYSVYTCLYKYDLPQLGKPGFDVQKILLATGVRGIITRARRLAPACETLVDVQQRLEVEIDQFDFLRLLP